MTCRLWLAFAAVLSVAAPAHSEIMPKDLAFAEGAVDVSLSGQPGNPVDGLKVMTTAALGNCVACHAFTADPAVQFPGTIAPVLDGVADRYNEAQLRGIVANAKMTFEGSFMPAFYKTEGFNRPGNAYTGKAPEGEIAPILNAQQIEDVVAYLVTLKE